MDIPTINFPCLLRAQFAIEHDFQFIFTIFSVLETVHVKFITAKSVGYTLANNARQNMLSGSHRTFARHAVGAHVMEWGEYTRKIFQRPTKFTA